MASNVLLQARGLLRLAQGRAREAVAGPARVRPPRRALGRREPAGVALALARRARARRLGEPTRRLRAGRRGPRARPALGRRRAGWASRCGRWRWSRAATASIDRLREAVAALAASPARLEHARALTDLGAALRRANRRADAREAAAARGSSWPMRCGARGVAEHARTELRIAGGPTVDPHATRRGAADRLRAARRGAGRRGAQQPRDRPGAVRHAQDGRDPPRPRSTASSASPAARGSPRRSPTPAPTPDRARPPAAGDREGSGSDVGELPDAGTAGPLVPSAA